MRPLCHVAREALKVLQYAFRDLGNALAVFGGPVRVVGWTLLFLAAVLVWHQVFGSTLDRPSSAPQPSMVGGVGDAGGRRGSNGGVR